MQFIELNAEIREKQGTGPARQLRREGFLPAVIYGRALPSQSLKVNEKEVDKILRTKLGKNTLIQLNIKGATPQKVIIKDYQGHVLTRRLTHVDFMIVKEDQAINVAIPVRIEGKAAGIVHGGVLEVISRHLDLLCTVGHIPEEVVVDVTNLNIGQNIHLADLKLPVGVKAAEKYNPAIVTLNVPKKEVEVAPVAATVDAAAVPATAQKTEGTAPAAAGAAAPAAAAKPAAKK